MKLASAGLSRSSFCSMRWYRSPDNRPQVTGERLANTHHGDTEPRRRQNQNQDLQRRGTEEAEDWWEDKNFNTEELEKRKPRVRRRKPNVETSAGRRTIAALLANCQVLMAIGCFEWRARRDSNTRPSA